MQLPEYIVCVQVTRGTTLMKNRDMSVMISSESIIGQTNGYNEIARDAPTEIGTVKGRRKDSEQRRQGQRQTVRVRVIKTETETMKQDERTTGSQAQRERQLKRQEYRMK